jgi:ferric-dicitrate binding protein FerR (iron transport regulator)
MTKELLKKFLMEKCTEEEFEQLLQWMREESLSSSGRALIEEIWKEYEPETIRDKLKYDRILDTIHHRINIRQQERILPVIKSQPGKNVLSVITRVAAVLLLPVLLVLIYTIINDRAGKLAGNTNDVEVISPLSSKMFIELGDGTKVWLNNGSKLKYPYRFTGKNRKVFLTGEAYFKIAPNKKMPFIVGTSDIEVKATGTEFNVMAYPEDPVIETALVEGQVILYRRGNGEEFKTMRPNECLKFNTQHQTYEVDSGNLGKYILWKDGQLTFKNDAIEQVAEKLARWYNIDISFSDAKAKEFTYTATFADESLQQVLELMQLATPITCELIPSKRLPDGSHSKRIVVIGLKHH